MPRHHTVHGRIVILGAGPCGLACADELNRLGFTDWLLLESAPRPGGLGSSVTDPAGFTWDLGGHVVFSHFGEFDRLLSGLFTPGELLHHDRSSFIRYGDRWVPYPFQHHLHALPSGEAEAALAGLLAARDERGGTPADAADFASWLHAMYGTALVEQFFAPYNTKVWATALQEMAASWVAERVAPVDVNAVLAAFQNPQARAGTGRWGPNATFAFPARGGTGEIWRRLAARLDPSRVLTGAHVTGVDTRSGHIVLASGERLSYEHLVATGPLDELVAMTDDAPAEVRAAARTLRHTTVAMVGLGYTAPTTDERSWLYFPQPDIPFYRATNFSKYAPANVPASDTASLCSWMTETAIPPDTHIDPSALARACDQALRRCGLVPERAELASVHVEMIPYAYPVPTLGRDAALDVIVPSMEMRGIHPRGRFGTWRYEIGNMDHAVKMGIDIARHLVTGAREELLHPTTTAPASVSRSATGTREAS
ncbi:protoporphyrinogen/coproporphyrinogen oxidase [Streptomyces sp. MS19]|uniref:protoporphyrinogen/coproporphyrinogen oxidase n=1 Tax=Streptomyces sp. MS19 TaxID=3385972 RepID=UPI0039A06507